MIPKPESQEGELRQGRRIYEIVGSPRAGYNLKLKGTDIASVGSFKLPEMEHEGPRGQVISTEGEQSVRNAMEGTEMDWWEMLTYMDDTDIEQQHAKVCWPRSVISVGYY
jgi:hypothetical protein